MSTRAWWGAGSCGIGWAAMIAVAIGACSSCHEQHDKEKPATSGGNAATPPPQQPQKTIDPGTVGTILGTVTFAGTPPPPTMIKAQADAACSKAHPGEFDGGDVLVKNGKVENAFVWVKKGLEDYAFPPPSGPVQINQEGCMYHPRIFGARAGQAIAFSNADTTLHNIDAKPTKSQGFNFVTPQGQTQARTIKRAEVMVKIGCDVHPWMRAYAGVLDHPFFKVTGADGKYELSGLPPGTYTIGAWHERLGETEQQVTLGPKASQTIDVVLPGPK